jgi:hypothetical protein
MAKQQTAPKPPANSVASAEQTIAALERDRAVLIAARTQDEAEMQKNAYAARVQHELGAISALREIGSRTLEHDQRLREIDAAIAEARERLAAAKAAEARAADRQRAAEARKLVRELGEVFPYLDRKLAEAANALIAINDGIAKLHQAGFAFPSDSQLRLGVAAIIQTWAHRLPRSWHDQLRDGFEFLAPGRRQTAVGYWKAIEPSLQNAIGQRLGEAERNTEAAA